MPSSHVAIVGAGPAGALLAFLLARGGARVTLVERHADLAREFRGEGLSPSGLAALREAGLLDEVLALPASPIRRVELYIKNRLSLALDLNNLLGAEELVRLMPQPPLLEMIIARAGAYQGFEARPGALVRDAVTHDGRVVGLMLGDIDKQETLEADYVVAADGRYSILRRRLDLRLAGKPQWFDVVWCKLPRPAGLERGTVCALLLHDCFGLVLPAEGDQIQIGRVIPKGSFKKLKSGAGGWFEGVAESLPPHIRADFEASRHGVSPPTLLDVECGSLPRWSTPGLMFIGDAAHPMSPVGAQGINVALRDAIVAANHLGPLLVAGADPSVLDAAALAFESERRREVDPIQRAQNLIPARIRIATAMSGLIGAIPDRWIAAILRRAVQSRAIQRFIQGGEPLRLTFGEEA